MRSTDSPKLRVAVDTGGTFTDFVVLHEDTGALDVFKVPLTRGHEADGIIDGLRAYLERTGAKPADVTFFAHGTTVGTNGLLEGAGARTGLIITEGFRGVYETGEQTRPAGTSMYDLFYEKPLPLVRGRLTEEVTERMLFDGSVHVPFDEASARTAIRRLVAHGVESVAVCLLFSFRNGTHERRIAELFAELAPQIDVSLSSEVAPEIREYYRLSTAVVNAYLNPLVRRYIDELGRRLSEYGVDAKQSYVMRSNGGVAIFAVAAKRSVQTILSGPAAGVVAAARTVAASQGVTNIVTFDMGGTSTDVALIQDGAPIRRTSGKVHGRDVVVPMLDIHTVAAGGGTLAWIDVAGGLQVGPQSAGALPGPACYGRGGTLPTVTDANVVLGLLSGDNALAGGTLVLDRAAAEDAIRRVIAEPLGISVIEAARGIVEIVNVQMEEAIKVVSSNRGYDLRDFHLLAYGGAGPLHAAALARDLGMRGVIVPVYPGAFSALGLLLSDVRQDAVISDLIALDLVTPERIAGAFERLQTGGMAELRAQGFAPEQLRFEYAVDLRYIGQGYELTIPVGAIPTSSADLAELRQRFDEAHAVLTGHSAPGERVELVNVRVTSVAIVPQASIAAPAPVAQSNGARAGEREAYLGDGFVRTPIYHRQQLAPDAVIDGPAILVQDDSTTVVHTGQTARVVDLGQLEIRSTPTMPHADVQSRAALIRTGAAALAGVSFFPQRARAQAAPVHLRVGTGSVEANAQLFYAVDMGFTKKNGLDVEVVKLRSGTTTMAAIVAGDLQCGVANTLSLGAAHQRNLPLVMIEGGAYSDASAPTAQVVVAPDSTIKGAKDLNGKAVAVISVGGLDQLAIDAYLDKNGGDLNSVKCIEVPPSAMAEALAQGRISAALMNDPELSQALDAKQVKAIAIGYDSIAKVFMQTAWFSTQDWLAQNKDVARRFGEAIIAGGQWGMKNPGPAAVILAKYTGSKEAVPKGRFAAKLDPGQIQPVYDAGLRYKLLPGPVNAADFSWNGK